MNELFLIALLFAVPFQSATDPGVKVSGRVTPLGSAAAPGRHSPRRDRRRNKIQTRERGGRSVGRWSTENRWRGRDRRARCHTPPRAHPRRLLSCRGPCEKSRAGEHSPGYLGRSSARGVKASSARSSGTARESDASSSERNASSRVSATGGRMSPPRAGTGAVARA